MKARFLIIIVALTGIGSAALHVFSTQADEMRKRTMEIPKDAKTATFAGGCFWCSESDFKKTAGVIEVISGYTGGEEKNPTYEDVSYGRTGHYEAVRVVYDPATVSYEA